ncbi:MULTISPECIES: UTP--glucose-1-phosphate uridylyltransferase [unclassified Psychrobacter]|uniref:UTP--glucose-1-phosphate uridylyltransferase n=1 Tax=unclassified Psychrobacter TaxID=196806 RepID=UPI000C31BA80|nr:MULTISPECIES: UTP--glucose-1-phosphate uridylyltransferase [unclassified Psychrobacter]MBA6244914.1 UTP--glucose-1-phosphate uridylyltransferase [Psychrobacter sp. Urea-trap-18]MBA6286459.1 UTP--glucose-1-phosphate uridylyltransferase [Psychrobacter sp. Urea-trap-16]MBA6318470.1 UTP--glucose-1-phosphate uridylyltransferase [Psychrobacter sp. Urea-trap-20]MBA6334691.1 UTP--glucose-1-phosphate uridylyltransferase [Psychrobacter sp. Urea-trap-19]PKG61331.1 UTP--glucose-1-phosphate uridylyltran
MKKITHAVIPVAGFGTRMLPLSKSVPKELLPLGNRPAIHYVVEEAIAAGIKHIVLVGHAQKSAIENYFDINAELDNQLRHKGKDELADSLNWLPEDVTVSMIRQGKALGLGHAVLAARPIIGEHDFAVLLPDVVLDPFTTDMSADNLAFMLDQFATDGHSQILVDQVADEDVHKYGIAQLDEKLSNTNEIDEEININASFKVAGFVEKPNLVDAPSNLAVVGRYVFSNHIFDYLANTKASVGGEIQLTDAIDALISEYGVHVTTMRGNSYDAGDMRSYMQAFIYFAEQQLADDE